jgi:hypothetical protein
LRVAQPDEIKRCKMSSLITVTVAKSDVDFPSMLERMGKDLVNAKERFEFLEIRTKAKFVGDMAKKRANQAKKELAKDPEFKAAYDQIIKISYQWEQDALFIRRRAEIILAQEYDNGVEEGRYLKPGQTKITGTSERFPAETASEKQKASLNELGFDKKEMFTFHRSAAVEKQFPGVVEAKIIEGTLNNEEPTITKVHTVEKGLFAQIRDKLRSNKKETKEEAKQQRQEKNAAHDEFVDSLNIPEGMRDMFKTGAKPSITKYATDLISRLEKEKEKLEEIMFYNEHLDIYTRRVLLPQTLGEIGDFFLECAKKLKNKEHVPNLERLTVINPVDE